MTVNLPVAYLQRQDLPERIRERVTVDPSRVVLEVTEEGLAQNVDRLSSSLNHLCEAGFRFAIDDFGMGYSSLSRLQNLPIQTLKIDKHFIQGIGLDPRNDTLVQTIHNLSTNLGLGCLAEGVETEAQRAFLLELGCELGHGFLFSAAVPPQQIPPLVSGD